MGSLRLSIALLLLCAPAVALADGPEIVSCQKIWDQGPHNAFTDLIRFGDQWFCTFREGSGHVPGTDGRIRVIASDNGRGWQSAALIEEQGIDLRDPKLTITPQRRLMIVAGGSVYVPDPAAKTGSKKRVTCQPRVFFSPDGRQWTPPQPVLGKDQWLWRVTWHKGTAYGASYGTNAKGENKEWSVKLFAGPDGVRYDEVTQWDIPGRPNETTLRFLPDDRMLALVRREGGNRRGWIGLSSPPYTQWSWHETQHQLGGPNFIVLPDGSMWAGSRLYPSDDQAPKAYRTVLARFGLKTYEPILTLPSGGDTSYPGLVWHEGLLWISYYSSHEGKTSIYLAKVRLPQ
jgi:hypothetical protein